MSKGEEKDIINFLSVKVEVNLNIIDKNQIGGCDSD